MWLLIIIIILTETTRWAYETNAKDAMCVLTYYMILDINEPRNIVFNFTNPTNEWTLIIIYLMKTSITNIQFVKCSVSRYLLQYLPYIFVELTYRINIAKWISFIVVKYQT